MSRATRRSAVILALAGLAACASSAGGSKPPEDDAAPSGGGGDGGQDARDAAPPTDAIVADAIVTSPDSPATGPFDASRDAQGSTGAKDSGAQGDGRVSALDAAPDVAADAGDPFALSPRCTSGKTWNGVGDQNMRPGEICSTCHSNYNVAGTLYPTGHEPDDCDGVDGLSTPATIVLTDATGLEITLYPNAAGNFFTSITVTPPYHARVVFSGAERAMVSAQSSGACNSCHTQTGASGAPGRIVMP
jgi:hypothetical protein